MVENGGGKGGRGSSGARERGLQHSQEVEGSLSAARRERPQVRPRSRQVRGPTTGSLSSRSPRRGASEVKMLQGGRKVRALTEDWEG